MDLTFSEIFRLVLLFAHLLFCALAIAQVLKTDLAIAFGHFSRDSLQRDARDVTRVLVLLWISGLAIIYLDTGFDLAVLASKPKLLLKLMCVLVLTANGIVLHNLSFPVMLNTGPLRWPESVLLAATGALSTSHWLMAAFIGIAKPLGKIPLAQMLPIYGVISVATVLLSLGVVPMLRRRLTDFRVSEALGRLARQHQALAGRESVPMHRGSSLHWTPSTLIATTPTPTPTPVLFPGVYSAAR